jgi:DNA polymerase-3 subunit beta
MESLWFSFLEVEMKIRVHSDVIREAAKIASKACAVRTPLDVLADVKVIAGDDVRIYGTNLNTSAACRLECDVLERGVSCFPAQRFAEILSRLSGLVTIKDDGKSATVQCGADRFRLLTSDPDKHPAVEIEEPEAYHEIKASSFMKALKRVMFCTDSSNARFAYGGIAFSLHENGTCWFVSSDSRRVSLCTCSGKQVGGHASDVASTVVALDGIKLITGSFPSGDELVKIHCGVSSAVVTSGGIRVKVPLLEGRFPDLVKQIKAPEEDDAVVVVSSGELMAGLRKTLIMSEKESLAARFTVHEDGALVISMATAEVGESEVTVFCEGNGKASEVLANASYLSHWLGTLQSDDLVRMVVPCSDNGRHVRAIQLSADSGSFYLLSPMNFD